MQLKGTNAEAKQASQSSLTMAEIARHSTANDCWMVIGGSVYDLSSFTNHPGGSTYVPYCGTDATVAFNTKGGTGSSHSGIAVSMLPQFLMGTLGQAVQMQNQTQPAPIPNPAQPPLEWDDD